MNHPALHGVLPSILPLPSLHAVILLSFQSHFFLSSVSLIFCPCFFFFFFFLVLQDHIESNLTLAVSCSRCHTNPRTYTATAIKPFVCLCVMVMHVCVWVRRVLCVCVYMCPFFARASDMSLYDMHWHICMNLFWCNRTFSLSWGPFDIACLNKK